MLFPRIVSLERPTYAHCSMFAKACNMAARFLRRLTFTVSTVFSENDDSRGGISGGWGALTALCPIDASFPVLKRLTASRVRCTLMGIIHGMIRGIQRYCTFSVGFAVFNIRTAHCIRVVGGLSVGTTGSASCGVTSEDTEGSRAVDGGGGGSANSVTRVSRTLLTQ